MKKEKAPVQAKKKPVRYKQREINLLEALRNAESADSRAKKGKSSKGFTVALAALAVIAAAGGYFMLYMHRQDLIDERDRLEYEIYSPAMLGQVYKAEQLQLKNDYLMALYKAAELQLMPLENADSQYLFYKTDLFTRIRQQFNGKIHLNEIMIDDAELQLTLTAQRPAEAAKFVKRLRDSGQFADISYTGFSADGVVTDNEAAAEFAITCRFAEKPQTAEGGEG